MNFGACHKHVAVDYCTTGGGVATDYCKLFAGVDPNVTLKKSSLVKMTDSDINEMLRARPYRLDAKFFQDDYVYKINSDGSDGIWRGWDGDLQQSVPAPYLVCPTHTKEAWDAYNAAQATEPTVPGDTAVDPAAPAAG